MFVLCLSLVTWLFTQHINKEKKNIIIIIIIVIPIKSLFYAYVGSPCFYFMNSAPPSSPRIFYSFIVG
jgi:hypothetical protein